MLRATPGWRRMKPARSRVSTIWWTEGGLTRKYSLHVGFGGRPAVQARVGVDERQILALLGREARGCASARHLIHLSIRSGPPTRRHG